MDKEDRMVEITDADQIKKKKKKNSNNKKKEMRTVSETSGTTLSAPTFKP